MNITYVLNVSISCPKACFISDANFLRIPVNDGHIAKISPFFDVAYRFIGKNLKIDLKMLPISKIKYPQKQPPPSKKNQLIFTEPSNELQGVRSDSFSLFPS